MQYLSSLPEGSCSEALKAALELEAVTLPSRDGLKAICELPKGVNALTNGDVLITSSTRCLQNPDITVEGEMIASCKIWTMQVVSIMKPKGIILFGRAPATQLFGDEMADGISDYEIRKHSVFGLVLKLPSLASIHRDSLEESQKVFEEFYEKVMI
jgi:uracil-DNA glycosylase